MALGQAGWWKQVRKLSLLQEYEPYAQDLALACTHCTILIHPFEHFCYFHAVLLNESGSFLRL